MTERVLNKKDFSRLLRVCKNSKNPLINQFIVLMAGILGMRASEIAHMKKHWIDFEKETITIPRYEPCNCKYCIHSKRLDEERQKKQSQRGKDNTKKPIQKMWHPKTPLAARTLPYGFNHDVKRIMEEMFNKYTEVPLTPIAISHKIRRLGESIGLKLFAHGLRATAATRLVHTGISPEALQVFMGWNSLDMAAHYIRGCGISAKRELESIYGVRIAPQRDLRPDQNGMHTMCKKTDLEDEKVDFINMKWDNTTETRPEIIKEARHILILLYQGEKSRAEIEGKLKRNRDVATRALLLIYSLGLIGTRNIDTKKDSEKK